MELQCGSADFPFFGVRFIAVTDGYDSLISGTAEDGLVVPLKNLINEAYMEEHRWRKRLSGLYCPYTAPAMGYFVGRDRQVVEK